MKHLILLLVLLSSVSFAYSQNDTIPQNNPDTSVCAWLYVYRIKNFAGSAVGYDLHIDDSVVCRVRNNSKYAIPLRKESKIEIWSKSEQKVSFIIDVKCSKAYYIKCGIKMGILKGRPDLSLISPEQGEVEYNAVKGRN